MSIVATSLINDLPLWALLAVSAVCGAGIACGGALVFGRWLSDGTGPRGGDRVSGAGSRRELTGQLEAAWRAQRGGGERFGLLVIDIDGFRDINLLYGRSTGDRVLAEVAERIRLRVRADDFIGRVDADEFAVICRRVSPVELEALRTNLEAYVNFASSVPVTLSIGVATPEAWDETSIDLLVRARKSLRQRRDARPEQLVDEALSSLLQPR